jgi:hypothetical protein
MATETVLITGNTFPVKDQLKELGAKWDADAKGWRVPADKAAEARALVANPGAATVKTSFRRTTCVTCGYKEGPRNARGYPTGDRILRSGECQSCYEERKMGY